MATIQSDNQRPHRAGAAPASLARVQRAGGTGSQQGRPRPHAQQPRQAEAPHRRATPGRYSAQQAVRPVGTARRPARGKRVAVPRSGFMKYATDNRFVRFVYELTTGPKRVLFYVAVLAFVLIGLYFPARDYYTAYRTRDILEQQLEIREEFKDAQKKAVDALLSEEGVKDDAREKLDMVMPGEKVLNVTGLDKDGNPVVKNEGEKPGDPEEEKKETIKGKDAADKDKGPQMAAPPEGEDPKTATEAEAAERAVFENSPWYFKVLDTIFGFDGKNGMAVVATGGTDK